MFRKSDAVRSPENFEVFEFQSGADTIEFCRSTFNARFTKSDVSNTMSRYDTGSTSKDVFDLRNSRITSNAARWSATTDDADDDSAGIVGVSSASVSVFMWLLLLLCRALPGPWSADIVCVAVCGGVCVSSSVFPGVAVDVTGLRCPLRAWLPLRPVVCHPSSWPFHIGRPRHLPPHDEEKNSAKRKGHASLPC